MLDADKIIKKFDGKYGFKGEELEYVISFIYPNDVDIGEEEITNDDIIKAHVLFNELLHEYPETKIIMDVNSEYITINIYKED